MAKSKKPCDRCHVEPRYGSNKVCKECHKLVVAEMKEAGYLETRGFGHIGTGAPKSRKGFAQKLAVAQIFERLPKNSW